MKFIRRLFRYSLYVAGALFVLSLAQVLAYRWLPVSHTPLMLLRAWEHRHDSAWTVRYQWVPRQAISPQMTLAVIASEDNRFEQHWGFDWYEIDRARNREKRTRIRGASTITQQVAKNLFLWPQRSWLRKGLEAYYTVLIECCWSKARIMEVYLNIVETGAGTYGVEAAAQRYYKKSALALTASEAAMIAVCLPNPIRRNPAKPTAYLLKRRQAVLKLMGKIARPEFV
ncbi:MAG: monofunctional biosynthetic peptidoglycan transglycosylase [Prevotellaceae bacterium]|jgi:monofunctional biosynthetic peptidoglycan transglycosylase|nr:monofunctional biosynthetic peptidoglycan transglycosylase [Prevotellaceae bacterium]